MTRVYLNKRGKVFLKDTQVSYLRRYMYGRYRASLHLMAILSSNRNCISREFCRRSRRRAKPLWHMLQPPSQAMFISYQVWLYSQDSTISYVFRAVPASRRTQDGTTLSRTDTSHSTVSMAGKSRFARVK